MTYSGDCRLQGLPCVTDTDLSVPVHAPASRDLLTQSLPDDNLQTEWRVLSEKKNLKRACNNELLQCVMVIISFYKC